MDRRRLNMNKIMIDDNFYLYQFEPDEGRVLGQNIYVLFHNKECIIFDAGYERHMEVVKEELKGYEIKYVILTHFHPDHCYGLKVLPKQTVVGSDLAVSTLKYFNQDNNELLIPEITVSDTATIRFYDSIIKLSKNKGHSNCGLLIDINSKYLLTGDEYMSTNDNLPVMPYVAESISQHLSSLNHIIDNYRGYTFLPSHGSITKDINNYRKCERYLNFALQNDHDLSNFYKEEVHFLNEKWHKDNLQKPV